MHHFPSFSITKKDNLEIGLENDTISEQRYIRIIDEILRG